ncbi:MAG: hypothetical protein ABFS37_07875, partial [Acidobacteriota bacterium]
ANDTPFHAIGQFADLLEPELPAVIIVKATFDLLETGELRVSDELMPLIPDPFETPFGELHGELYFKKEGADLCVLGTVRREEPAPRAIVSVQVGSVNRNSCIISSINTRHNGLNTEVSTCRVRKQRQLAAPGREGRLRSGA